MLEVREIAGQAMWNQGPSYKEACDKQNLEMAHASSRWVKPQIKSLWYCNYFWVCLFQPELH